MTVTEDSSRAGWLWQARSYLRAADPVMARLSDDRPDYDPRAWMSQCRREESNMTAGNEQIIRQARTRCRRALAG